MKLKFKKQAYQSDAVEALADCFVGQRKSDGLRYRVDPGHSQINAERIFVLTNLESLNSVFIRQELPSAERLVRLNEIAISQMRTLLSADTAKRLQ